MTTKVLSLKIFPHDDGFRFDGWQDEFRKLVDGLFTDKLPGVLPDFKGFTKNYNRANWFQPKYDAALARTPLVVRVDEDDYEAFKYDHQWQHKLRLAWHHVVNRVKGVNATQTVVNEPTPVSISTNVLPLTVKDTEAYKAIMASKSVKFLHARYCTLDDDQSIHAEKDALDTLKYVLSQDVNLDGIKSFVENKLRTHLKALYASNIVGVEQSLSILKSSSEIFIIQALVARFYWQVAKEMQIDVEQVYKSTQHKNKHGVTKFVSISLDYTLNYLASTL